MPLSKSKIFYLTLLSSIAGVGASSFFGVRIILEIFISSFVFLPLLFLLKFIYKKAVYINYAIIFFIFLVSFFFGIYRYQKSLPLMSPDKIWFYNGKSVSFQGIVFKEPDERIDNVKYALKSRELSVNGGQLPITGKVLVTSSLYPKYSYGDFLEIECRLKSPESFDGFDYENYLGRYDIYSVCYFPRIEILKKSQGNIFMTKIFKIKNYLRTKVNENLPEPESSFFNAMILGSDGGLPRQVYDQFALTGIVHIIAISGSHIVIIFLILNSILNSLYFSRKQNFYLISVFLIVYLVLIGFPASAVRAGIMGFLVLLAYQLGRLSQARNALILAAAVMILINPKVLKDDVGFQLSFLSVLGLIYFYPYLGEHLKILPKKYGLRDSLAMTLSAQIMTFPIVIYIFGRLSLIAPVTNIVILPVLPYVMGLSFFTLAVGFIINFNFLWWPEYFALGYVIKTVKVFSSIPFASVNYKISEAAVVLLFLMVILFLNRGKFKRLVNKYYSLSVSEKVRVRLRIRL